MMRGVNGDEGLETAPHEQPQRPWLLSELGGLPHGITQVQGLFAIPIRFLEKGIRSLTFERSLQGHQMLRLLLCDAAEPPRTCPTPRYQVRDSRETGLSRRLKKCECGNGEDTTSDEATARPHHFLYWADIAQCDWVDV